MWSHDDVPLTQCENSIIEVSHFNDNTSTSTSIKLPTCNSIQKLQTQENSTQVTSAKSPKILYDSQAVRKMFPGMVMVRRTHARHLNEIRRALSPWRALAWKSHRGESGGRRVAAAAACHLVLTWRRCMFLLPQSTAAWKEGFIKCY
jgi:hypothetical protein